MGKITDITKQKRNKTRVNIFIDGEFVCGLDEVAVASARFKIGDEISADEFKNLVKKSELNSAFERAVGYLGLAPRARKEISRYLKDKGYDGEVIDATLAKLDAYHYIDDYGYAQTYIKSKSKKYGAFRIAAELRQKGISSDIIDITGRAQIFEFAQIRGQAKAKTIFSGARVFVGRHIVGGDCAFARGRVR